MISIGIRELRQNASEYIRRVASGESILLTDRGRPVARLVPLEDHGYDALVRRGLIRPGTGSIDDLGEPIRLPRGATPPSEILRRMREDER